MSDSLLPRDTDAEEAVLGSIFLDSDLIGELGTVLQPGDFYREKSAWIYQACLDLHKQGAHADQITVAHYLADRGQLDEIGGPAYLSYLVARVPTPFLGEHYAELVHRTALQRRIIDMGGRIAALGYQGILPDEALARARAMVDGLVTETDSAGFVHISDCHPIAKTDEEATEASEHIPTGFQGLDKGFKGGLPRGSMTLIAGETTVGKSAFSLAICRGIAKHGFNVGIITLEMTTRQVYNRLKYSRAGVDSYNIRSDDYAKLDEAVTYLDGQPIWLYSPMGASFDQIRGKVIRQKLRYGMDALLYDYIGLEAGVKAENEVLRRAAVVRQLRALSMEADLALLAVTPLSRDGGQNKSKLSRLAWTSELEYHADVVGFVFPVLDQATKKPVEPTQIRFEIEKNRVGIAKWYVDYRFDKATQRIWEI